MPNFLLHEMSRELPGDVMGSIFTYAYPLKSLRGRGLADSRPLIGISKDVPAVATCFEEVIELDATTPIPSIEPCPDAMLRLTEVKYIVSRAKELRKIRVTHIPGNSFIPRLTRHVEELEFLDSGQVDISPIAQGLHTICVHDPTEKTLEILVSSGRKLKNVAFKHVNLLNLRLVDKMVEVFDRWGKNLVNISVIMKESFGQITVVVDYPFFEQHLHQSVQIMRKLSTYFIENENKFYSLRDLKLGTSDQIYYCFPNGMGGLFADMSRLDRINFQVFRLPLWLDPECIKPRITCYVDGLAYYAQNRPHFFDQVEELSLLRLREVRDKSMDPNYEREIRIVCNAMSSLSHLSVRVRVVEKEISIANDVFNFIRFALDFARSITVLEVTKDFILLPRMSNDMATMLFSKMAYICTLVVTNKPREVLKYENEVPHATRNKAILASIPKFLDMVTETCPQLECLFLEGCGELETAGMSAADVRRELLQALAAIAKYEKTKEHTDISSMRYQVMAWLRALDMANEEG